MGEAIRTAQFIRNQCIRLWMDRRGIGKYDLSAHSAVLTKEFPFAGRRNSMARQAAAERAWSSSAWFNAECKAGKPGKTSCPHVKRNSQLVEYKTYMWKVSSDMWVCPQGQPAWGQVSWPALRMG